MSGFDVNEGEMARARISDQDVERLLAGNPPDDPSLLALAPLLERLSTEWDRRPSPESVSVFARAAARLAGQPSTPPPTPVTPVLSAQRRLRPRLALALTLLMVVSTLSGVAIAAESSLPGDTLHGVKLALEKVGIGRGGVEERLSEATLLASHGMHDVALAHAVAALTAENGDEGMADAVAELEETIDKLSSEVPANANQVRSRVAEMLQWMLDNAALIDDPEAEPGAFGRGVAAMARQIGLHRGGSDDGNVPGSPVNQDHPSVTDEGNRGSLGGPPTGPPGPPTEGIPPNRP